MPVYYPAGITHTDIGYFSFHWQPMKGCTECCNLCKFCFAKRQAIIMAGRENPPEGYDPADPFAVVEFPHRLTAPLQLRRRRSTLIGVCFMGDLFHKYVSAELQQRVLDTIEQTTQHRFLLLTQRLGHARRAFKKYGELPSNMYVGTTVGSMKTMPRVQQLNALEYHSGVNWLSVDPVLEPLTFPPGQLDNVDLAVISPETGPVRRTCRQEWLRSIVAQCEAANTEIFIMQMPIGDTISKDPAEWPDWARPYGEKPPLLQQ